MDICEARSLASDDAFVETFLAFTTIQHQVENILILVDIHLEVFDQLTEVWLLEGVDEDRMGGDNRHIPIFLIKHNPPCLAKFLRILDFYVQLGILLLDPIEHFIQIFAREYVEDVFGLEHDRKITATFWKFDKAFSDAIELNFAKEFEAEAAIFLRKADYDTFAHIIVYLFISLLVIRMI